MKTLATSDNLKVSLLAIIKIITLLIFNSMTSNAAVILSPFNATVCNGSPVNVGLSGAYTYTSSPVIAGIGSIITTGTVTIPAPSTTTNYTIQGYNSSGALVGTSIFQFHINDFTFNLNTSASSICEGEQTSINATTGSASYTWAPATGLSSTVGQYVTAKPTVTTTYTVTGSNSYGCSMTKTITITVSPMPIILSMPSPAPTICAGSSYILELSTQNVYYVGIFPSNMASQIDYNTYILTPSTTTEFTLVPVNSNICLGYSSKFTVNVDAAISLSVNSYTDTICAGSSISITGYGASNLWWTPNATLTSTGATATITPTATTTYYLNGDNGTGCNANYPVTITVLPAPVITTSITAPINLCPGEQIFVSAFGGIGNYFWTSTTGEISVFSSSSDQVWLAPSVTSTYTVTGSNGNCSSTATVTIIVGTLPILNVSNTSYTIPHGSSVTLSASGTASYYEYYDAHNTKISSSSAVTVSPSSSTSYRVIGFDNAYHCAAEQIINVTVEDEDNKVIGKTTAFTASAYPNPSTGEVNVVIENNEVKDSKAYLYDIAGNLLKEYTFTSKLNEIKLTDYENGNYLLKVVCDEKTELIKLVKI